MTELEMGLRLTKAGFQAVAGLPYEWCRDYADGTRHTITATVEEASGLPTATVAMLDAEGTVIADDYTDGRDTVVREFEAWRP